MNWAITLLSWIGAAVDHLEEFNWPLLLVTVLAFLQFLYFDVALEIEMLPRLVVFILGGQ